MSLWLAKNVKWAIAALLFYIGITEDIPAFVADKWPLLQALGGANLVRAVAVLAFVVVAVLAIGPTRIEEWRRWISAHLGSKRHKEELKRRCRDLSQDIFEFWGDRQRDNPNTRLWQEHIRASQRDPTPEGNRKAWDDYIVESRRYQDETLSRFNQRFGAKVQRLVSDLEERDLITHRDRAHIQFLMHSDSGIPDIAKHLGAIGHKN